MFGFSFRRIVSSLKRYPRASLVGAVAITTTAKYSFIDTKLRQKATFLPGVRLSEPILKLENLHDSIKKRVTIQSFKTKTPLYPDKERTYEGYDVLKTLTALNIKPKNDLIIFTAKDGFKSHIPLSLILKHRPVLAIRQQSAPQNQNWELVDHALNGKTDGGPFYLMWPGNTAGEVMENHWAFGVVEISFGSFQNIFGDIAPIGTKDPQIMSGFKLFAQNCSCCHTFFKKGSANVGTPFELIPKKYPTSGAIAAYAANPPQYSLMPRQDLPMEKLNAIERYVRFKAEEGVLETPKQN